MVNSYNPDLKVSPAQGKVFHMDSLSAEEISQVPGIVHYSKVVEENALFRYQDQQHIGVVKGVDSAYGLITPIDTLMLQGRFRLNKGSRPMGVIGQGVAYYLGVNLSIPEPVSVYVPRRDAKPGSINPMSAFNQQTVYPTGVFAVESKIDEQYIIMPLENVRQLYDYNDEVSALEIKISDPDKAIAVARDLQKILGEDFIIENRLQQQKVLYKILRSEKWITFLILSLILIIATFNVIGSLSLVILDKKKDIAVLYSMGANEKLIKRIFLYEGLLITLVGALGGIFLGGLILILQQQFGLISMGSGGTFIIDSYPVKMEWVDFIAVFTVVMLIGWLTSLFPVRHISKNFLAADRKINPE